VADGAIAISVAGVLIASIGGGVSLYNARKAVQWKRAEFANAQLRELLTNQELSFACRCLDWNGGLLVLPEQLQPLIGNDRKTIDHDHVVFAKALEAEVWLEDMAEEPRLQIYRTAADTLLTWLGTIEDALSRGLFKSEDMREAKYWLDKAAPRMTNFIDAYGYRDMIDRLTAHFDSRHGYVRHIRRGGFGATAAGRSAGG
jgi:hypothetical protein